MTRFAAFASAAVLVLALGACSGAGGGDGDGGAGEGAIETQAALGEERVVAEGGDAPVRAAAAGLPGVGPRVVKTAMLRLSVGKGEFEAAVDEARATATALGGFVVASSARQVGRGRLVRGSLVVRVPARAYERALRELRRVGRVQALTDETQDVSAELVDLEARRRHLEAVERQLLSLLERARTVPAALAVQSELNRTQLELERVLGRLRFLDEHTAYATISLAIAERGVAPAPANGGWGVVGAWEDGARAFLTVAGRIFVLAAGAAPVALLVALAWLGARLVRRRVAFPRRASGS